MKTKIRNLGILGIESPKEICKDENCPFHGYVGIRGRIFRGRVVSDKTPKTVLVKWDRRVFIPKYERFEKRWSKVSAHLPACLNVKKDDVVMVGECRPISKTKKFVVISKVTK